MIRKPSRQDAKRLVCGSLVAASSVFIAGVGFSASADAASTALTATPAQTTYQTGGTATINVTSTGTPTALKFVVTSGPDKSTATGNTAGVMSCTGSANPYTCSLPNGGTAGTDNVTVFDDINGDGFFDSGDTSTTTSVTFSGDAASFTEAKSGTSTPVGVPETFTLTAKDSAGNAAVNRTLSYTFTYANATGGATPGANPLSLDSSSDASATSTKSNAAPYTLTGTVNTNSSGVAKVAIDSSATGTVSVRFTNNGGSFAQQDSYTVVGGNTGNDAVASLTVSPTTATGTTGGSATFTATAKDSSGNPVSGATISYVVTAGPDAAATTYRTCTANTAANGTATCTISNTAAKAGSDSITFYVNTTNRSGAITGGPDTGEQQATGTATFSDAPTQPAYDQLTFTCQDQAVGANGTANGAATSCTVPSGTASSTFTATVKKKDANNVEQPVSGETVNFAVASGTATLSAASGTTGADGTVTVTATPSTTTAGTTYSVKATPAGAGTPTSATATVTYAAPTASTITLTPASQNQTAGGTASVKATVTTQFGGALPSSQLPYSVTFTVSGRNAVTETDNVGTDGTYTFTYKDTAASNATATQDSVVATHNGTTSNTATVNWLASTTVSTVKLSVANGTTANCPTPSSTTTTTTQNENAGNNTAATVCVLALNSSNQAVPNSAVTLTVDKGFITATAVTNSPTTAPTGTTVSGTTGTNGTFTAYVGSATSGTQTITAKVGSATATGTVVYAAGEATKLVLTPATATVAAGGSQKFTATVTDAAGNPVQGDSILFQQSGPGSFSGTSSANAITDASGQASATLSVPAGATGSGSVTAADQYTDNTVDGSSTYTVGSAGAAKIAVSGLTTVVVRNIETATATVTDSSGAAVANAPVSFATSGTQDTTGTATTDANGKATFSFRTEHAGTVTVTATSGSASGQQSATIQKQQVSVTLQAVSTTKGTVTLTAYASPVTGVVVGATMGYYQRSGNTYIGPVRKAIGTNGGARVVLNRTSGTYYTFYATVVDSTDVTATPSAPQTVQVK